MLGLLALLQLEVNSSHIIADEIEVGGKFERDTLFLKCFIQGYFDKDSDMKLVFQNQHYNGPSFGVDSILIVRHKKRFPFQSIDSAMGLLYFDGSCKVIFKSYKHPFYIAIHGSSFIETWSSKPVRISSIPAYYDFTNSQNMAYGENMSQISNGIWAFYTGDVNQDGYIDQIDVKIVQKDIDDFQFGHRETDLNGDGNIDLLDRDFIDSVVVKDIKLNSPRVRYR